MKADNIIVEKSMAFAVRIVKLSRYLRETRNEYLLTNQVLRSGTSIGANVHEALYGQSRNDFVAKMSIALKEASETLYWIKLFELSELLSETESRSITADCEEILKLLSAIVKSAKAQEK